MNKKKLFILPLVALLAGCNSDPSLTELDNDEVLVVGNTNRFRNYQIVEEEDEIIRVPVGKIIYTLNRSSYNTDSSAYYMGYYYYFEESYPNGTESRNLGKKTLTTTTSYSYMAYGKDNMYILVETAVKTKIEYSYSSHWENYSVTQSFDYNEYFSSYDSFKTALPSLASYVEGSVGKVYCDATGRETVTKTKNFYETYYYIENV